MQASRKSQPASRANHAGDPTASGSVEQREREDQGGQGGQGGQPDGFDGRSMGPPTVMR